MLRGLDYRGGGRGAETIVRVAGRDTTGGRVTAYVDAADAADDDEERLATASDHLEAAGVVDEATVRTWQDADVVARYEEYVDAVGADALEPHFESLAGGNALDVPAVCLEVRDADGTLTGLYPQSEEGAAATVEDGLRALRTGEGVENVATDPALTVEPLEDGDEEAAGEELDRSCRVAKAD